MFSQFKNIFSSKAGIGLSCAIGGFSLYWLIQNFKNIGTEKIIDILFFIALGIIFILILFNLFKIIKDYVKSKSAKKRDISKNESLRKVLGKLDQEKLDEKTWAIVLGESNWFFNDLISYPISEGNTQCTFYKSDTFVYIHITTFTFHEDWQSLFKDLNNYRNSTFPINSIILLMPVTSLLTNENDNNIKKIGDSFKEQLEDISKSIMSFPPIYIALSEMEKVFGFTAFMKFLIDTKKNAEQQVFGWNNTVNRFDQKAIQKAFEEISQKLNKWGILGQLGLMNNDKLNDTEKKDYSFKLFAFQEEFRYSFQEKTNSNHSNQKVLKKIPHNAITFLGHIFEHDFDCGLWRGFYFLGKQNQKQYFFANFLQKVYQERHLVIPSEEALRKGRSKLILFVLVVLLIVLFSSYMIKGYRNFRTQMQDFSETLQSDVRPIINLTKQDLSIQDFSASTVLPKLNKAPTIVDEHLWFSSGVKTELALIKDAFCTKTLFRPVILQTSKELQYENLPKNKDLLISTIEQGLLIMAGFPLSEIDPYEFIMQALTEPKRNTANRIWKDCSIDYFFPKSDYKHLAYYLRLGLGNLYNHWLHDSQKTDSQGPDKGKIADKFYMDSLQTLENRQNDMNVILIEIKTLHSKLASIADKEITRKHEPSCEKDYQKLLNKINSDDLQQYEPNTLLANLRETIERHQTICATLSSKNQSNSVSNEYQHIWDINGGVTEELKDVINILEQAKLLYDEFLDAFKNIDSIDLAELKNKKLIGEDKLNNLFTRITSPQWKPKTLQSSLIFWLEHVFENLRHRVIESTRRNLYSSNEAPIHKKSKTSFQAPTKPVYKSTAKINSKKELTPEHLLNAQQDFIQKMQTMDAPLNENDIQNLANDYKKLVFHWWRQLNDFDPLSTILSTQTWSAFKERVCQKKGKFINVKQDPLENILSHISQEKLQQLKLLYAGYEFDDTTLTKEKELITFSNILHDPVFLNQLEKAQNDFYDQVKVINIGNSQSHLDQIKYFTQFVDNCEIPQSQLHLAIKNLPKIESQGVALFKNNTKDYLRNQFDAFVDKWRYRFDQYPFIHWVDSERSSRIYKPYPSETETVLTASLEKMHTFFFDEHIGLKTIYPKFGTYFDEILSDAEMKFLQTCQQWQNFLFDSQNNSTKKHQIKFLLDTEMTKKNFTNTEEPITKILIPELFDEQPFSIDEHNKTMTTHWGHNLLNIITIQAYHESQKRVVVTEKGWISSSKKEKVESVVKKSELIVQGGDLFLIACTNKYSENGCENFLSNGKTRCHIQVDIPELGKNSTKNVQVSFWLEWDEIIPDKIIWDEIIPDKISWP